MSYWDDLIIAWIESGGTQPCDVGDDEGWDNYTVRWVLSAESEDTVADLYFRWQDASNHYLVRLNMTSRTLALVRCRGGAETTLATSAAQPYLKPGVRDSVRVDTFVRWARPSIVSRVLLDGEEVVAWTEDIQPGPLGGTVGAKAGGAAADISMCEVSVWPVESGTRLLTGDV